MDRVAELLDMYLAEYSANKRLKKRPGRLVLTSSGKKGIVYNDDKLTNDGKVKVHLIDDNHQLLDQRLLCDPAKLKQIGFTD